MYRPAARTLLRATTTRTTPTSSFGLSRQLVPRQLVPRQLGARTLTTAPPHKTSRSWKNLALRLVAAGGIIYWYNTTNVFAEDPTNYNQPPESHFDAQPLPTIDQVAAQRKEREALAAKKPVYTAVGDAPKSNGPLGEGGAAAGSPDDLEAEAGQQGAFNEETGEINWDCPCLGGMADGPCGPDFKEAFSCFVFSKEEPKGVDCIDKFKHMQDCFRAHPDLYGAELDDDEQVYQDQQGDGASGAPVAASSEQASPLPTPVSQSEQPPAPAAKREEPVPAAKREELPPAAQRVDPSPSSKTEKAKAATEQVKKDHTPTSESEHLVPRAAHDAR
ncbi:intermembrane space import and assembly protein 40 [Venturia nashicola]|nr:intermembrane space import and assembly protein 40 [Venturia nashicola]